ncbi:EpsG family protein [Vibrio comitans]|uniref:EpsG family protein n=2 Tax=Vibrio comitans TaxID=413401 RepID=UPI003530DBF2
MLLVSPLLSAFYGVVNLFNNKHNPIIIAFSLSMIFIYLPLPYDMSSNFFSTQYSTSLEYLKLYNYLPFYSKGVLPYAFWVFCYTFIIFYIWFYILRDICEHKNNKRIVFTVIIFLLMLTYRDVLDLNRTYLAYSIMLFGFYNGFIGKRKGLVVTCIILAMFLHSSSILLGLLALIPSSNKRVQVLLLPLIGLLLGSYLVNFIVGNVKAFQFLLSGEVVSKINNYTGDSVWGISQLPISLQIRRICEWVLFYSFCIYLYLFKEKLERKDFIYSMLLFVTSVFWDYRTLYERYALFTLMYLIVIISQIGIKSYYKMIFVVLLSFRFFIVNFYSYGHLFTCKNDIVINCNPVIGNYLKLFYIPTPLLLNINIGNSDEFIYKYYTRGKVY